MSKINDISIVMPFDGDRFLQLQKTINAYVYYNDLINIDKVEFLFITRLSKIDRCKELRREVLKLCDIYDFENRNVVYDPSMSRFYNAEYFNPTMALNCGVKYAKYDNIIITSPEVMPLCNVIGELRKFEKGNYICKVLDEAQYGGLSMHGGKKYLVGSDFRSVTPAMYFLGLFQKNNIYAINGWDMKFMQGYGFEDDDFGSRFMRAGFSFEVKDDIQAIHQYHPRGEQECDGWRSNQSLFDDNNKKNIIRVEYGIE